MFFTVSTAGLTKRGCAPKPRIFMRTTCARISTTAWRRCWNAIAAEGFVNVLVTGSLDFAMAPVVENLGFEHLLANRLEFAHGRATGRLLPPVLAGETKVEAMLELCRRYNVEPVDCRAYSDDTSDLPMLEAVGEPIATNPKPRLAPHRRRAQVGDSRLAAEAVLEADPRYGRDGLPRKAPGQPVARAGADDVSRRRAATSPWRRMSTAPSKAAGDLSPRRWRPRNPRDAEERTISTWMTR